MFVTGEVSECLRRPQTNNTQYAQADGYVTQASILLSHLSQYVIQRGKNRNHFLWDRCKAKVVI